MKGIIVSVIFWLGLLFPGYVNAQVRVCAIGDSQVEPGSAFVRNLQRELGDNYVVDSYGRRGWTTSRWIRSRDFGSTCASYDVVLVSLGGNDIAHGRSWSSIYRNIKRLIGEIPWGRVRVIYHMTVPRFYPGISLTRDGIHLTPLGAQQYAQLIAPFLRLEM